MNKHAQPHQHQASVNLCRLNTTLVLAFHPQQGNHTQQVGGSSLLAETQLTPIPATLLLPTISMVANRISQW